MSLSSTADFVKHLVQTATSKNERSYCNDPKFFGQIGLGKQCIPRSVSSVSTLFAILSASFGCITLW